MVQQDLVGDGHQTGMDHEVSRRWRPREDAAKTSGVGPHKLVLAIGRGVELARQFLPRCGCSLIREVLDYGVAVTLDEFGDVMSRCVRRYDVQAGSHDFLPLHGIDMDPTLSAVMLVPMARDLIPVTKPNVGMRLDVIEESG